MADRIKGITVEIGGDTTGLSKALSGVNKEINGTQRQLKDVERLLKMDPGNTELLRQKYELLNKSVEDTESKLDSLKEAEKQVQQQFNRGEATEEQYNALKREIIATETSLRDLKSEAQKTEKAVSGIDEKPIKDVEKAADEAGDALEDAGKDASSFGDYLKAGALIEGAKGIVGALKDVAEESKEYMKIMGSLEVSSDKAGYSADQTRRTYKQLYGVLGDDQTAATTTANLQALGLSQADLVKMTNNTIGAWATYGDSIPIDGLAEAINETAKTGTVTGTLADALNWAGVSEDDFNTKLENANSESERANLIMQQLSSQGLEEAGEAWQTNNQALVENNQAQADLQDQMAQLGEKIMPIITLVVSKVSELLSWFNSLDSSTQTMILGAIGLIAVLGPVIGLFGGISTAISFLAANPIVLLIAAIVGLVALIATKGDEIQALLQKVDDFLQGVFITDWTEVFGPELGNILNGFFKTLKGIWDGIKQIFDGIIEFIQGVFTGDWDKAWNGVKKIFQGIWDSLVAVAKAPLNLVIGLLNGAIAKINILIAGLNQLKFDIPDWVPFLGGKTWGVNIPTIPKVPYLANGGILSSGSAVVGEAGPELLTMLGNRAMVQPLTSQTSNTTNMGGINIIVYGSPGQDVNELAEIISEKINTAVERKGAAFA